MLSVQEYERPTSARPERDLIDVLLESPLKEMGLTNEEIDDLFARDKSPGRDFSFDEG